MDSSLLPARRGRVRGRHHVVGVVQLPRGRRQRRSVRRPGSLALPGRTRRLHDRRAQEAVLAQEVTQMRHLLPLRHGRRRRRGRGRGHVHAAFEILGAVSPGAGKKEDGQVSDRPT